MTYGFGSGDLEAALAGLEASRARMHEQLEAARIRAASFHELVENARQAEAVVRSPRGEVEVTAGADGSIHAVRFGESAFDLTAAELGRITTQTVDAAQRAAVETLPPL